MLCVKGAPKFRLTLPTFDNISALSTSVYKIVCTKLGLVGSDFENFGDLCEGGDIQVPISWAKNQIVSILSNKCVNDLKFCT